MKYKLSIIFKIAFFYTYIIDQYKNNIIMSNKKIVTIGSVMVTVRIPMEITPPRTRCWIPLLY